MNQEARWIREIQKRGSRTAAESLIELMWRKKYIAVNKIIDRQRKLRPGLVPLEDMELPDPEDFAAQIQDRALLEEIKSYVSALSPQVQAVFPLRVYGERSFPEIAAALGEKEAAVKTRYYRLMCQLRKEFTPYD